MNEGASATLIDFLNAAVADREGERAVGTIRDGAVAWRTWREVADDAARLADAMRKAGIVPGDRVAQVSENRYEWIITDLAIHMLEAVHVPIHVTLSGRQIAEQIADSGARLVFVSSEALLAKFREHLPQHVAVGCYDSRSAGVLSALAEPLAPKGDAGWISDSFAAAVPSNSAVAPGAKKDEPYRIADGLATILYTSGTTGRPRGVMLSQRNLTSNAATVADVHGGGADQTRLCILPLSHIYARTCDLYTWLCRGCRLVLAESRETLLRDCKLVRPDAMSAVPFVYQRIAERVRAAGPADEAAALRDAFGGRIARVSCGGAPLAPPIESWYAERGLPILPGYGLTESSPVISMSTIEARRAGSVGLPLPGIAVRIAGDGEVLVRGQNVMLGYWRDEAATGEAIRDGWLHTGDLGKIDADGYLFIHGRKKELIALSTGKKVFPTRVETLLASSPWIEQAVVFGDDRPGLAALIVPAEGLLERYADPSARIEVIAGAIADCLREAAQEEQVRHFSLLSRPLSIDRGELTPKLSVCRETVARNFAAELEAAMHAPTRLDGSNVRRANSYIRYGS